MRAFVLAAGLGTRLLPLTWSVPKCLVPIGGRPLLAYWLDLLASHGVDNVLVNSHHLHECVAEFVASNQNPVRITLAYEPTLLGSAGTLRAQKQFVHHDREFFVVYGDTLTNADLTALLMRHQKARQVATLGLFRTASPQSCGIAVLNERGIITDFEEKPLQPRSDLAFGGVMVASSELLGEIPGKIPCDLGRDVFPRLGGRMAGWQLTGYLRDIGTLESYRKAQSEVEAWSVGET